MKILISNDDSVFAQGIKVLHKKLTTEHNCIVVAPDRNCSGFSNKLSLDDPLRIQEMEDGFHKVNGTPSDCVHLAIKSKSSL